jgi:hypothetical protein
VSKEVYNNLIVIVNIIFVLVWVGMAIHMFHSHPEDIVEGVLFTIAAIGQTAALGLGLHKLFNDRLNS